MRVPVCVPVSVARVERLGVSSGSDTLIVPDCNTHELSARQLQWELGPYFKKLLSSLALDYARQLVIWCHYIDMMKGLQGLIGEREHGIPFIASE